MLQLPFACARYRGATARCHVLCVGSGMCHLSKSRQRNSGSSSDGRRRGHRENLINVSFEF